MTVTTHRAPAAPDVEEAWAWYADTFFEINERAAQRHLMTYPEFAAVYHDPLVYKFYVHDHGKLVGMSVLTNELEAWPLISPQYFAKRWPEHFKRSAIWYVGFVGVAPRYAHAFRQLVSDMYTHVIGCNGIAVMDFCSYNVSLRRLPEITLKLLGWINPAAGMEIADSQTFVVYSFDQGTL
jgi:hypothetical protein